MLFYHEVKLSHLQETSQILVSIWFRPKAQLYELYLNMSTYFFVLQHIEESRMQKLNNSTELFVACHIFVGALLLDQ